MDKVRAAVEWIPREQGGRREPPLGVGSPPYASVVRFTDAAGPWPPPTAWSLAVEKDEAFSEPYRWIADVHFVADQAPHSSLRPGRQFDLYEGGRCVAHCRVLAESFAPRAEAAAG